MLRSIRLACLAAFVLAFVPLAGPNGSVVPETTLAAGTCTGWTSDIVPPASVRVLRTAGPASGTVQAVPFHDYVTVVMAAEWGPGNPAEALKAGAVAVEEYAWYHAMFWRGGSAPDGSCYDVVDSSLDQVYAPESRVPATSHTAAVDATWGFSVRRNTSLFVTHYQAGANVPCGANADGAHLYQLSATHCAQDGMTFDQILATYYGPGVEIVGGAPAAPTAVALQFAAQPSGGTAGLAFAVQPVVAVVDASGQTFVGDPANPVMVTLSLAAPIPGVALTCSGGLTRPAVAGLAAFDGCQLDGAAAAVVLLASATSPAPASASPFTVTAAPPTITLVPASTVVSWGQDVQLAATVAPSGPEAAGGRVLHLERSIDGVAWEPVADLATDTDGRATVADRPATNARYRLVFDGAPDMAASTSPIVRVLVRRVIQLRPDSRGAVRRVARGTTVSFSTLVRPAPGSGPRGRVEVRLYQLVGRSWVARKTRAVTPDQTGAARLQVTFGSHGSWRVRACALATTANAISILSPAHRYDVR